MSDSRSIINPHVDSHDYYTIDSGVDSTNNDLGRTYYRLTCGNGDGYGFYENGQFILNASDVSIEKVGKTNDKSSTEDFTPAKIILAENGDIYFEARNGDVIIKGNNIIMSANGPSEKEGHVLISANETFSVDANATSIIAQENGILGAKDTLTIAGSLGTNISSSLCTINDGDSFVDSLKSVLAGGFNVNTFLDVFNENLSNFFNLKSF
tara:strand:- start:653 stop:1282 length:630 start_codon:yes stop_codon:yes gene_type:complete